MCQPRSIYRGFRRLILAGLLVPGVSWALSGDINQPMQIEADRVELDHRQGVSTYWGNVQVTQGSMRLTASKITVHNNGRYVARVVAVGKPARFKQRPDNQQQDVKAIADRIEYYGKKEQIVLIGAARVWQADNVFQSERIEYDMKRNSVNAGSGKSEITDKQRVRITIQPQNNSSEQPTESAPQ